MLARRGIFGRGAALAYTLTGLCLIVPAFTLPFATISKFGGAHASLLFTGIVALWQHGMIWLAVWAATCGIIAPAFLLGIVAALQVQARWGKNSTTSGPLARAARTIEYWSMPEVHILAVLVAFIRLGTLVNVTAGPGLWCYAGMALAALLAWQSFDLSPSGSSDRPARTAHLRP